MLYYTCSDCKMQFDDLSDTIFQGHHQPLRVWILSLYFIGSNLSNDQIAQELDLASKDAHIMTSQLRVEILAKKPIELSGEVETDDVYVTAGQKGYPAIVASKKLKAKRGRGTLAEKNHPV